MAATVVAGDDPYFDCPADLADECMRVKNGCLLSQDNGGDTICRRCKSGTKRNEAGHCSTLYYCSRPPLHMCTFTESCRVDGCNSCSADNVCEACVANRQLTANGTCARTPCYQRDLVVIQMLHNHSHSGVECPRGCQACGPNGECWPCGRVFRPTAAHTLASVSFRCNLTPDAIINANPEQDALKKLAPDESLIGINKLKLPPAVCTSKWSFVFC